MAARQLVHDLGAALGDTTVQVVTTLYLSMAYLTLGNYARATKFAVPTSRRLCGCDCINARSANAYCRRIAGNVLFASSATRSCWMPLTSSLMLTLQASR